MVIYEVNLAINPESTVNFVEWLNNEHINEMMSNDGFYEHKIFYRKPEEEGVKDKDLLTIHYFVHSRKNLEEYLQNKASEMRQRALDHFKGQFDVNRRILYHD